jgi:signal peptidase I
VSLIGLVVLVRAFVIGWYPVTSGSMSPTVRPGDRVLVDKLTPRFVDPGRGDLVTFHSPVNGDLLVKRVVAVAGDRVKEPYVDYSRIDGTYFGPVTVPPDHLFVLGDNRFGSIDSRVYGPIATDAVTGRVLRVIG